MQNSSFLGAIRLVLSTELTNTTRSGVVREAGLQARRSGRSTAEGSGRLWRCNNCCSISNGNKDHGLDNNRLLEYSPYWRDY